MKNNASKPVSKGKHRVLRVFLALFILAALFVAAALLSTLGNNRIIVTNHEVEFEKLTAPFRIALISDLHRKKFDEENQYLVDTVKAQEPDIICVGGDMLEHKNTDEQLDALVSLFERLGEIAPVYFVPGNHDYDVYGVPVIIEKEYVAIGEASEMRKRLEGTGAVFLESSYIDTSINGERVRIGGFYPFAFRASFDTDETYAEKAAFLSDFCDTDAYKIMLSHRPDSFTRDESSWDLDIDLVLSGHTHGGVVRMPFGLGAIFASGQFFPKYDMGKFALNDITLIITAGFDGHSVKPIVPRIFNPPEMCVIDVLP